MLKDEQRVSLEDFVGGSYRQNLTANYDKKGGNYMFLHTYTFTIDIVALVLEDQCFAGHVQEYGGIIVKMHHQRKCNIDLLKGNRRRPIQLI
jgi:hypothetical protein